MEERKIMRSMEETTALADGKYIVNMLWKEKNICLPNNREVAKKRLRTLLKRLRRSPGLFNIYCGNIEKYIEKGYARKLSPLEASIHTAQTWYLPHHPVFNVNKPGKVRVVFDAASKFKGVSLNSMLNTGPDLANKLIGVLLRFRNFPFTLVADIEGMFHQVQVAEKDRDSLRFLWVESETSEKISTYQMKVHIFGATDSPCCASYALRRTAEDNKDDYSEEAYQTVLRNFYVDDLLKSVDHENGLLRIANEVASMLRRGGFNLTKFISNSDLLLNSLPASKLAHPLQEMDLSIDATDRALGIKWHVKEDQFLFSSVTEKQPLTKRGLLKTVSSIFDPLGFLAPFTMKAKVILQNLWRGRFDWDELIDTHNAEEWLAWLEQLKHISAFKLNRCYILSSDTLISRELHCFSDASELAFGAVCYMRSCYSSNQIVCSLISSKSRIAPLKPMTMPRLELQGAVLGSRLTESIKEEIDVNFDAIHYWVDSTIVLQYIYNESKRFKVFVGNRVSEIRENSEPEQWHHVSGEENPADDITRGLDISEMGPASRWVNGPEFLSKDPSEWPKSPDILCVDNNDPEVRPCTVLAVVVSPFLEFLERSAFWMKAVRVCAWILRFISISRKLPVRRVQYLVASELQSAKDIIFKLTQRQWYGNEVSALEKEHAIHRNSSLLQLRPFLSEDGLLKVGGRLKHANIPTSAKHQIILPGKSWVSRMLVQHYHQKDAEVGLNHMMASLRLRYWIVGCRALVKGYLRSCFLCKKRNTKPLNPLMATLPRCRLAIGSPAFHHTGVDYFGPILIRHGRSSPKRWGCIFTCLTTRAIHLEVAESLTTDDFINVLKRFVNRRGNAKALYSDCGTNFKGAHKELKDCLMALNQIEIGQYAAQEDMEWHFNPPDAPHMGGAWERLVGCVKVALRNIVKERLVTDFQLMTLLTEIETIINSRPLTETSDDINDLEALTPNHFLLGRANRHLPMGVFTDHDLCSRKRWRQVQLLADHFWKRFRKEYLPSLTKRVKWNSEQ